MSENKYFVPKGMLDAAYKYCPASFAMPAVKEMLLSAIQWLSKNPIMPTAEQFKEISVRTKPQNGDQVTYGEVHPLDILVAWQRQMFLAPELETITVTVPKAGTYDIDENGKATAYIKFEENGCTVWRPPFTSSAEREEGNDLLLLR